MPKFRQSTTVRLHIRLADAAVTWRDARQPVELHRYVLRHGAGHLAAAADHDRLWHLLLDEEYRNEQITVAGQYDLSFRAMQHGLDLYVRRGGQMPDDDARLCWLLLRAGRLGGEARRDILAAFDGAQHRQIEDGRRIPDALARIAILDGASYFNAALLLFVIESSRQLKQVPDQRSTVNADAIVEALEKKMADGNGRIGQPGLIALAVEHAASLTPLLAPRIIALVGRDWKNIGLDSLLKCQLWDAAKLATGYMPDSENKACALGDIALSLSDAGRHAEAMLLFELTCATIQQIDHGEHRANALAKTAAKFARSGEEAKAKRLFAETGALIDGSTDQASRFRMTANLAQSLALAGNFGEAQHLAQTLKSLNLRVRVLASIAQAMALAGQADAADRVLGEACDQARIVASDLPRAEAFGDIAVAMVATGRFEAAHRVVAEAESTGLVPVILTPLVQALCDAGQLDKAIVTARRVEWERHTRARSLAIIAAALAGRGQLSDACQLFTDSQREDSDTDNADLRSDGAICDISSALATAKLPEAALFLAQKIHTMGPAVSAYALAARAFDESGRSELAEKILARLKGDVLAQLKTSSIDTVSAASVRMAKALADTKRFDSAIEFAHNIEREFYRDEALSGIASKLAHAGRFEDSARLAFRVGTPHHKASALAAQGQALAIAGRTAEALDVFSDAETLASGLDVFSRNVALRAIALALAQARLFPDALRLTRAMDPGIRKGIVLSAIARGLAQETRTAEAAHVLFEAQQAVNILDSLRERARWAATLDESRLICGMDVGESFLVTADAPLAELYVMDLRGCIRQFNEENVIDRIRKTLRWYPFNQHVPENGVLRLLESLIGSKAMDSVIAIARECPQLGLEFLAGIRGAPHGMAAL